MRVLVVGEEPELAAAASGSGVALRWLPEKGGEERCSELRSAVFQPL